MALSHDDSTINIVLVIIIIIIIIMEQCSSKGIFQTIGIISGVNQHIKNDFYARVLMEYVQLVCYDLRKSGTFTFQADSK